MRYRITVRSNDPVVELRGYVDGDAALQQLAAGVHPWLVIASPAGAGYNPFVLGQPWPAA